MRRAPPALADQALAPAGLARRRRRRATEATRPHYLFIENPFQAMCALLSHVRACATRQQGRATVSVTLSVMYDDSIRALRCGMCNIINTCSNCIFGGVAFATDGRDGLAAYRNKYIVLVRRHGVARSSLGKIISWTTSNQPIRTAAQQSAAARVHDNGFGTVLARELVCRRRQWPGVYWRRLDSCVLRVTRGKGGASMSKHAKRILSKDTGEDLEIFGLPRARTSKLQDLREG